MKLNGIHLLVEFYGCDFDKLNDKDFIRDSLITAAQKANCNIVGEVFHQFEPQGVTGIVVVSESHLSVHTYPEHQFIALDIFTCTDSAMPYKALAYLQECFLPTKAHIQEVNRGH